jgi:RNA polymerase-binding transcription factor DksA
MNKQESKQKLEEEKKKILEALESMGRMDKKTHDWVATSEGAGSPEADSNEKADQNEEYELNSSIVDILEERLKAVEKDLEEK